MKLVIQDSGFIVALVVTEHVLQYSVVYKDLLQKMYLTQNQSFLALVI